jgi:putative transposase
MRRQPFNRWLIPKRYARLTGTYFVISRTWESRPIFKVIANSRAFIDCLLRYRNEGSYQLHAFVLMPEHFHILLTRAAGITVENSLRLIKGGSSHSIHAGMQKRFPVWQRGFSDHRIRDAAEYGSHLRYLEDNPRKRNLVLNARDYEWSSASGAYGTDPPPGSFLLHVPPARQTTNLSGCSRHFFIGIRARLKSCPNENQKRGAFRFRDKMCKSGRLWFCLTAPAKHTTISAAPTSGDSHAQSRRNTFTHIPFRYDIPRISRSRSPTG